MDFALVTAVGWGLNWPVPRRCVSWLFAFRFTRSRTSELRTAMSALGHLCSTVNYSITSSDWAGTTVVR
jgi:hypothetical protein